MALINTFCMRHESYKYWISWGKLGSVLVWGGVANGLNWSVLQKRGAELAHTWTFLCKLWPGAVALFLLVSLSSSACTPTRIHWSCEYSAVASQWTVLSFRHRHENGILGWSGRDPNQEHWFGLDAIVDASSNSATTDTISHRRVSISPKRWFAAMASLFTSVFHLFIYKFNPSSNLCTPNSEWCALSAFRRKSHILEHHSLAIICKVILNSQSSKWMEASWSVCHSRPIHITCIQEVLSPQIRVDCVRIRIFSLVLFRI